MTTALSLTFSRYWAPFVHGIKTYVFPVIDVLYNDVMRLIWNDLFLPIANILIYIWDAFVQLIGFVMYVLSPQEVL